MGRRVLVLEDDESLRLVISKALSRAGFEVRSTASPDTALDRMASREADALVADVLLGRENFLDRIDELARLRPDAPVVVMSAQTTAATAIGAVKSGAFEYLPKPFDLNTLVEILQRALQVSPGGGPKPRAEVYPDLIGRSPAMQDAFRTLGRLAGRRDPVLIVGPEGSGRAAAARVLHRDGVDEGPLMEAGPERMAHEGYSLLETARQGSVLLRRADAWTETVCNIVLETLEGDGGPRIIATASSDAFDRLPGPLLDRLAIGLIHMPPVRERGADRAMLFRHFLNEASNGACTLKETAETFINAQVWPGEVSQIRQIARRLAAQGPRGAISEQDIAALMQSGPGQSQMVSLEDAAAKFFAAGEASGLADIAERAAESLEAGLIRAAMEASGGVRLEAAKRLGMNRNTFARKLDALVEAGKLRPNGNSR